MDNSIYHIQVPPSRKAEQFIPGLVCSECIRGIYVYYSKRLIAWIITSLVFLESQLSMKALAGLLWASAALEACTVVGTAVVYTSESWLRQEQVEPPSISPDTARLLLAQRLGLSQYHSLQDADDSTLNILNTYGGVNQPLFAQEELRAEKLLLVVEGVDEGSHLPAEVAGECSN